jgi:hypothetical protein
MTTARHAVRGGRYAREAPARPTTPEGAGSFGSVPTAAAPTYALSRQNTAHCEVFVHPSARASTLVLALVTALLAGCSSDALDVDGFAPGACTEVAPSLEELDATLRDFATEDLSAERAGDAFQEAQDALLVESEDAEEPVREAMTALVTDLGFLRVATDNELADATPQEDARKALDALAEECRGS